MPARGLAKGGRTHRRRTWLPGSSSWRSAGCNGTKRVCSADGRRKGCRGVLLYPAIGRSRRGPRAGRAAAPCPFAAHSDRAHGPRWPGEAPYRKAEHPPEAAAGKPALRERSAMAEASADSAAFAAPAEDDADERTLMASSIASLAGEVVSDPWRRCGVAAAAPASVALSCSRSPQPAGAPPARSRALLTPLLAFHLCYARCRARRGGPVHDRAGRVHPAGRVPPGNERRRPQGRETADRARAAGRARRGGGTRRLGSGRGLRCHWLGLRATSHCRRRNDAPPAPLLFLSRPFAPRQLP